MQPLFRTEAVAHATGRLDGGVLLPSPLSVWVLGGIAAVVLALAVGFAANATYARKETVSGWLSPPAGMVRAVAPSGGLVSEILVAEGEVVERATPLARISLLDRTGSASSDSRADALRRALVEQREAREKALEATVRGLAVDERRLRERGGSLRAELDDVRTQIELQNVAVAVAGQDLAKATDLARRGHLSQTDRETAASAFLDARQTLASLGRTAKGLERKLSEVDAELDALPEIEAAAKAEAQAATAALDERITRLQMEVEYVVSAPIDGRIEVLPVRAGQTVTPGGAVAVVVPAQADLVAELFVPSRAAGFVKPGQRLRLKYQAFPFERYGAQDGVVTDVSLTVLWPQEAAVPGLRIDEPVFRVHGRLAGQALAAYGDRLPLRAGMLLTADIVVDRRTLVEWLLDPIYAVGRR